MRILTVRQPWAWAIIHAGKDVENRARNIAGAYRGPVAIHAAKVLDLHSARSIPYLWRQFHDSGQEAFGAIIGVVDLVDVHGPHPEPRCGGVRSPWAQRDAWHMVVENPRALAEPIAFKGALGLRTLDEVTTARVVAGLA
jgi:hypothetical protein